MPYVGLQRYTQYHITCQPVYTLKQVANSRSKISQPPILITFTIPCRPVFLVTKEIFYHVAVGVDVGVESVKCLLVHHMKPEPKIMLPSMTT